MVTKKKRNFALIVSYKTINIQTFKPLNHHCPMEKTLILLKPCTVQRRLIGEVINRIERKGLRIVGLKMMQLDDAILNEHYAHLTERPFFPWLVSSMKSAPVVAMCVEGNSAVTVVRNIVGATNGRKAAPGTIRGDYSMRVRRISSTHPTLSNLRKSR
jgi:nucleoside-diphosphate kinase